MADAVALVVKGGQRQPAVHEDDQEQRQVDDEPCLMMNLLNLLLKQLSGIPLRDTVVKGTRQSGIGGNIFAHMMVYAHHLPRWKSCRCKYSHPRPQHTWPPSEIKGQQLKSEYVEILAG